MKGTRFAWRAQQHRLPSIPHALHALWSALRWNSDEDAAALSLKPHLGVRPHLLPSAAKHLVSTLANHPELRESATRKPRTCAACPVGYFRRAVTLRSCIAFRHEPPRVMRWLQSPLLSSSQGVPSTGALS
jgi:hypothetical protein